MADPGVGKTTLVDWLVDIIGGGFVITPKKKPNNWCGLDVYGCTPKIFNYDAIADRLEWVQKEMYQRYDQIDKGEQPPLTNFVVDEWRLIVNHVPDAKKIMKDIITVARESGLRMVAIAQGLQVSTWGLEGESDLEECFTDILIGQFALDKAAALRRKHPKNSEQYVYWTQVLTFLDKQERPCIAANMPAIIPDLSDWRREILSQKLTPAQALGEPLRTIWRYCKEQSQPTTTRDVLRKGFTTLKNADTEAIKKYFLILAQNGYGEIEESGTTVKFRVF